MKTTTPALAAHIEDDVTRLATCWRIRRADGVVMGFTTHDRPLDVGGLTHAPSSAFTPSAVSDSNRFNVDNMEVTGVLSAAAITEADLMAGRYDHAEVSVFMVDWANPDDGRITLRTGRIGEVTVEGGTFMAEIQGLMGAFRHNFTVVYSPECRAVLGDDRCRADLSAFRAEGVVASVTDARRFTAEALGVADDWFAYGRLRWHTGANVGLGEGAGSVAVKRQTGNALELEQAMTAVIQPGDRFSVTAGCDKRFETCAAKFSNAANFRGEPRVPGTDAVLDYPGIR